MQRNNIGWKILSLFLALIIVAGVIVGVVFWDRGNIVFNPIEQEQPADEEEQQGEEDDGGAPVTNEDGEEVASNTPVAMPMAMTFRSARSLDGVEAAYDSVTLKATVEPINATDKRLDWSVSFVNPSDAWATGKTVTDYVTVTPTSDGADTATVQCLQDFGAKIKVTAASRAYSDKKADCTIDFAKRIEDISFSFQPSSGGSAVVANANDETMSIPTWNCSLTLTPSITYSDFTVEDTFAEEYTIVEGEGAETMYAALAEIGGTAATIALSTPIPFVGSSSSYPMESSFMDNASASESGDPYYYGERPELFNDMFAWLRDNSTSPLFAFEFELTGTYSSVSGSIDILFDAGSYVIAVSGVSLNQSSIIV